VIEHDIEEGGALELLHLQIDDMPAIIFLKTLGDYIVQLEYQFI
jgi:hypothetical protein